MTQVIQRKRMTFWKRSKQVLNLILKNHKRIQLENLSMRIIMKTISQPRIPSMKKARMKGKKNLTMKIQIKNLKVISKI
jgi:hypothetical protein